MIATSSDLALMAHPWLEALLRASWQGAVAVGLVWCLCRALPRMPASVRCWLWRLALLKFLFVFLWPGTINLPWLPAEGLWGVRWSREMLQPSELNEGLFSPAPVPAEVGNHLVEASVSPALSKTGWMTFGGLLWLAWVSGIAITVAVLLVRARTARRWRKGCKLVKDADVLTLCETVANDLGVYQPPVLFVSDACDSPVVFGAVRTSVVLPAALLKGTDLKRLQLILRHELAHVCRGDLLWNWLATVVWVLFFFHPLVWVALRELRLNQELACDAYALGAKDASLADYGSLLVELADGSRKPGNMLVTVGVVESFEFLKRRLKAINDLAPQSRLTVAFSAALVSAALLGLLPWRLIAQPPSSAAAGTSHLASTFGPGPGDDKAATDAPDDPRPPLATISAGEFTIAVERVRWVHGQARWRNGGFPVEANFMTDDKNSEPAGSEQQASGLTGRPNLVVDLHVSRAGEDQTPILCTALGEVRARDDRGKVLASPYLPAHLNMQIQGVDYPAGSGRTAIHLHLADRQATSIRSLAGELLVAQLKVQRTAFEAAELTRTSIHRLDGVAIRLTPLQFTDEGFVVDVDLLGPNRDPFAPMLGGQNMRNRLGIVLEDSEGRMHECESAAGGGGGGLAGAGAWVSSADVSGGHSGQTWSADNAAPLASWCFQFAALPPGVTARKIVCTVTDTLGVPQRLAIRFENLPLP